MAASDPTMEVRLSDYSVSVGDALGLTIEGDKDAGTTTHVGMRILEIGESDFDGFMATSVPVQPSGDGLRGELDTSHFFKAGALYEIDALELYRSDGSVATLLGGQDFSRTAFRIKDSAEEPTASAWEALAAAQAIEVGRERLYAAPLGDPERAGGVGFRALVFVERVMLTRPLRVPGVQLLPLRSGDQPVGNTSTDETDIINGVLRQLGWRASLDIDGWREATSRERPITVVHAPRVFAASEQHALELVRYKRDRLLDLLALHRGSYGVPFATVIQPLAGSPDERYASTRFYPEVATFAGNRLGGEASGESPKLWLDHDRAVTTKPFVALCLSLFKEAQGETDLDFAYFRYWGLLELIAHDRVESELTVADFEGGELKEGSRKATTSGVQGRVYELLKRHMLSRNYAEHHFGQPLPEGLWDAVQVWYACRNAAAHYGRFRPDDPAQQARPWYLLVLKAYEAVMAQGGYAWGDPYFGNLRSAAESMVRQVLDED